LRGYCEPLVERPALIRFNVREANVTKLFHRHDARNRLADKRKHLAWPGVKKQRFIIKDEILIE
jgi:hypothetical protein